MKVFVLAAGSGENLHPFNATRPKGMFPICGSYILENILNLLRKAGLIDIHIIVGHRKEKIQDYFDRGHDLGVNLTYLHQESPQGIGNAMLLARDLVSPKEYFLLVYSDILVRNNIFSHALQTFNLSKVPVATICLPPSSQFFGNVYLDGEMHITRIIEKPQKTKMGNYVLAGVFVLPGSFLDLLEEKGGSMEDALGRLIEKEGLQASIWDKEWIDIGFPWDILTANQMVMNAWEEAVIARSVKFRGAVRVEGAVHIQENVIVESGTTIQGPCFIGAGSFIGHNVLVRKYTSLGPETEIGFGVELKNCVLLGRSKVGRLSFVGDSVVGEDVYLGSGIVTVNGNLDNSPIRIKLNDHIQETGLKKLGAFIGDGARIGAGHTLRAGTVVRAGSTISPHYSILLEE